MELSSERKLPRRPARRICIGDYSADSEPVHDLRLYVMPPTSIVPLAEVYDVSVSRLKVLKILERALPGVLSKSLEEQKCAVLQHLQMHGLETYIKLLTSCGPHQMGVGNKECTEDYISHFTLRLIYCRTASLRDWFLKRELELFRLRFLSLDGEGVESFEKAYQLKLLPISDEEKSLMMEELTSSTANMLSADVKTMAFYKVPYNDVLDLMKARKVYIHGGSAYVPKRDLVSVFCTLFKKNLHQGLQVLAASSKEDLEADERFRPLLMLPEMNFDRAFNSKAKVVVTEDLDDLSGVSFPPCMRQIHQTIRQNHHAKHGSRVQYGLFLKGIGLPLDGAVQFWRDEFTKIMTSERFQKEYFYGIRHNYGQEGRRVSYTPYSCSKILSTTMGPGDCHGCPFKHNSRHILSQRLESYGIPMSGVQSIINLVSKQQYQHACTKYFEVTHPSPSPEVISHPNRFFQLSRKILSGDKITIKKTLNQEETSKCEDKMNRVHTAGNDQ